MDAGSRSNYDNRVQQQRALEAHACGEPHNATHTHAPARVEHRARAIRVSRHEPLHGLERNHVAIPQQVVVAQPRHVPRCAHLQKLLQVPPHLFTTRVSPKVPKRCRQHGGGDPALSGRRSVSTLRGIYMCCAPSDWTHDTKAGGGGDAGVGAGGGAGAGALVCSSRVVQ